ncbi:MAG: IMP cyclohydrolase [Angelakisella sp.]
MDIQNIDKLLSTNPYPGRGIVTGLSADGKNAVIAYFIMGRSENSRNRVFTNDGEGIRTEAADPAKLTDPSLIIYSPVRVYGSDTIVTNGDQTDTIYDFITRGDSFQSALETRTFEPDGPNWTPRISGMVTVKDGSANYRLSILKSSDGNGESTRRYYFTYPQPVAGEGHFIHTYRCDGSPIPSFEGEPVKVAIPNDKTEFENLLWNSLNTDNKVSLFVRYIDLATGKPSDTIINKYNRI